MNEKKYKAVVAIWGVIFLTLQALSMINVVGLNPILYSDFYKLVTAFLVLIMMALTISYLVLSLKKKKAGPIIGIVIGTLYILVLNIINILVGVCFIVSCVSMLKDIEKCEAEIVEKQKIEEQKDNIEN